MNPFETAVPFSGQTTRILTGVSPERDCYTVRFTGQNPFVHEIALFFTRPPGFI